MSDWKSKRNSLLEAHVQHELDQLSPANVEKSIESELSFLYDWIGSQKVGAVTDRAGATAAILQELREGKAVEAAGFLDTAAERILKAAVQRTETVEQLAGRDVHDRFVEVLLESKDLRTDLATDFARSLFFRRLISEVLFFSLRSFLSEDNILAKSVPGVSSLFKFGQNLVNKTLPGLDENVSKIVRDFIGRNMDNVIKYTETVLAVQMDDKLVKELADDFWNDFSKRPVSKMAGDLAQVRGPKVRDALLAFWDPFRKTDFCADLVTTAVNTWFDVYQARDVKGLLDSLGWDRDRLLTTGVQVLLPVARNGVQNGYWEGVIRRRLEAFYMSEAAQTAFSHS